MRRIRQQCDDDRLTTKISLTPEALARAVRIAGELARRIGSNALRVDFLTINATHFAFGEVTFTPAACAHRLMPRAMDHLLGDAATVFGNDMSSQCFGSLIKLISCGNHMPYRRRRCSDTSPEQLRAVVQEEFAGAARDLRLHKLASSPSSKSPKELATSLITARSAGGRKLLSLSAAQSGDEDDHAGLKDEQLVSAFGWVSLFVMGVYLSGRAQSPLYRNRSRGDDSWGQGVTSLPPTATVRPGKLTDMM